MRTYAGVGSRETPRPIALKMYYLAIKLSELNFKCVSGGARQPKALKTTEPSCSADQIFETACTRVDGYIDVITAFKPTIQWNAYRKVTQITNEQYEFARQFILDNGIIPHFDKMKRTSRYLHARNFYQIKNFDGQFVEFVICYSPLDGNGEPLGGTRTAIKIAEHFNIPVFNLASPLTAFKLDEFIKTL